MQPRSDAHGTHRFLFTYIPSRDLRKTDGLFVDWLFLCVSLVQVPWNEPLGVAHRPDGRITETYHNLSLHTSVYRAVAPQPHTQILFEIAIPVSLGDTRTFLYSAISSLPYILYIIKKICDEHFVIHTYSQGGLAQGGRGGATVPPKIGRVWNKTRENSPAENTKNCPM